jgi:hypothetical protein
MMKAREPNTAAPSPASQTFSKREEIERAYAAGALD